MPEIVEFSPPPAISNNGKPEPAYLKMDANGAFFENAHGCFPLLARGGNLRPPRPKNRFPGAGYPKMRGFWPAKP